MEKKNTGLIVLVVILSLLVVGLGGYIVYDKVLDKEDSNINNDVKDNNNIQNNTDNNVSKINDTTVIDENSSETFNKNINDHNVYIDKSTLRVDNKDIIKLDGPSYLYQVTFYNDIIITYQSFSLSGTLIIYDYNGNVIKKIDEFKDENNRLFNVYLRYSDTEIFNVSSDGKVLFVGTKHLQGGAGAYLTDDGKNINVLEDNTIADDSIVSGIFEFSYLGNNTFSDIKYVSTKMVVKDLK